MKILVILEDPTRDKYIVTPIIEKIFKDIKRTAQMEVLTNPHLRGIDQALHPQVLAEIVEDNRMVDLFLVVVDRDCNRFHNTERLTRRVAEVGERLIGCLAVEEVEVWMLAVQEAKALPASWKEIKAHCDPKETYASHS